MSITSFAAKFASDLIDELDHLEDGMHLKFTFTVEPADEPDNDTVEPITHTLTITKTKP